MPEQDQQDYIRLKTEIEDIREKYSRAKKVFDNIESFTARFQGIRASFEDGEGSTKAQIALIDKKAREIEAIRDAAQMSANTGAAQVDRINQQVKELEAAYATFSENKGRAEGRIAEIESLQTAAKGLRDDIESSKNDAQRTLTQIKKLFEDVQAKVKEIQDAYQNFLQIKAQIDDKNTGLAAAFKLVQDSQSAATKLIGEIREFRDEVNGILDDVRKKQKEATEMGKSVADIFDFSQQKKKEIQDATDLIIDTSFAENFERRRKDIEDRLFSWNPFSSWKTIFIVSILLLAGAVLFLAKNQLGSLTGLELAITRLFYTSPLIVLAAFAATQYSKERDMAERYAFKAVASAAIRNHMDLLVGTIGKNDERVKDFIIETFRIIYKEPHKDDEGKKRIQKIERRLESLERNNTAEPTRISDITSGIKELKGLFSDESVFKQVIDLITRLVHR